MSESLIDWKAEIGNALIDSQDPTSHVELDSFTFHPSQISNCKRQCYLSKLGIVEHDEETLGNFLTGTLLHQWIEENVTLGDSVLSEQQVEYEDAGIQWTGHTDCWDIENDILYDFKTRGDWVGRGGKDNPEGNWMYLDPPVESHINQLHIYMRSLEVKKAKIVYIDKKNIYRLWEWPEDDFIHFDWERYNQLNRKAREIAKVIEEEGIAERYEEIPFEKCDCWICGKEKKEDLVFQKQKA